MSRKRFRGRTRNNIKIADLLQELKLSEERLYSILKEVRVKVIEGQKNLDQQEAARVRQYLNEQKRRADLKKQTVDLPSIIKVSDLAQRLRLPVGEVLSMLLNNGVLANLNDDIDYETAAIVASDLGYTTDERVEELEKDVLTPEKLEEILKKEKPEEQVARPPVVTIMGHVDHGKTTLLDAIRKANVAKGEAGGITQAISGYQVEYKGRMITFIDTPGHETFEFMRKRGVSLADIAILVVAADDGVKPQTKEAVKHAREAGVPIVVAINKIDKGNANIDKTKKELAELDLNPEEWGGNTVVVPISALKKEGIDELMELVLLTADVSSLKAIEDRPALGSVIESHLDKNLGPLATVLIHTGSLKVGDAVVAGRTAGKVRRLLDWRNKPVSVATPSMPVTVVGLNEAPAAGDIMQAVKKRGEALGKAGQRRAPVKKVSGVDENDDRKILALVIKADSRGSVEAIEQTIESMVPPEVRLSIIRADVGAVSDSDVLTAHAAEAIIYAFNVTAGGMTKKLSDKERVPIKMFDVIYRLSEDVRGEIENRLPIEVVRTDLGKLKVLKTFFSTQKKRIVGGDITEGKIEVGAQLTVWRKEDKERMKVGRGKIVEMQRGKQKISYAEQGDQVGLTIEGKGKIKKGDVLEIYKKEEVRKKSKIKA